MNLTLTREEMADLARRAREGDEASFERLLGLMRPYFSWVARTWRVPGMSPDDIFQELSVILWRKAIPSYREDKGGFFAWARRVCWMAMWTTMKSSRGVKQVLNRSASLSWESYPEKNHETSSPFAKQEAFEEALADDAPGPDEAAERKDDMEEDLRRLVPGLTAREKKVLPLYVRGMGYREIASRLGLDRKQVDNAVEKIRRKAREVEAGMLLPAPRHLSEGASAVYARRYRKSPRWIAWAREYRKRRKADGVRVLREGGGPVLPNVRDDAVRGPVQE